MDRYALVLIGLLVLAACGDDGPAQPAAERPTLPADPPAALIDGQPPRPPDDLPPAVLDLIDGEAVVARTLDRPLDGAAPCADDAFDEPPVQSRVVVGPTSYAMVISGSADGRPAVRMCEWDAEWRILVADDVAVTGTTEPVGPTELVAFAAEHGVADGGWPAEALVVVQQLDGWAYVVAPGEVPAALRFRVGADGDLGQITFLDWHGEDVTP